MNEGGAEKKKSSPPPKPKKKKKDDGDNEIREQSLSMLNEFSGAMAGAALIAGARAKMMEEKSQRQLEELQQGRRPEICLLYTSDAADEGCHAQGGPTCAEGPGAGRRALQLQ